jgi:sugar phosphate permease
LYETGAILGSITLGYLSDKNESSRRSPTAIAAISVAFLISLTFVIFYDAYPEKLWLFSMFCFGAFLGSIHHMICITVAADLGRSHSKQATSTITGIIDGIGSSGNGLG